jgi:hypothetical protein
MKTISIRTREQKFLQIACDTRDMAEIGFILNSSKEVEAFNILDEPNGPAEWAKYSGSLSSAAKDAMTNMGVHNSIVDAIVRINEERETKYAGCYVDSWVGSPGDYSPPDDCVCNKCITNGRNYRYSSYDVSVSREMFQYFEKLLLKQGAKSYKWGTSYTEHAKCEISLHNYDLHMTIRSNKTDIKIGPYIFHHESKDWTAK